MTTKKQNILLLFLLFLTPCAAGVWTDSFGNLFSTNSTNFHINRFLQPDRRADGMIAIGVGTTLLGLWLIKHYINRVTEHERMIQRNPYLPYSYFENEEPHCTPGLFGMLLALAGCWLVLDNKKPIHWYDHLTLHVRI
jgi:hypothetical protein